MNVKETGGFRTGFSWHMIGYNGGLLGRGHDYLVSYRTGYS
jgi:hypothetical protein